MADKPKQVSLESLSPPAQDAIKQKALSGVRRFQEWRGILEEIAVFDASTDALRLRAQRKMAVMFGLAFLCLFVGVFSLAALQFGGFMIAVPILVGCGLLTCVVLGICAAVKVSALKKCDLANDFRVTVFPVLELLAEDIGRKGKVALELDLGGATPQKVVSKEKIPPGRFSKLVETVYHDPWCRFKATLVDGNEVLLEVVNNIFSYDRYWRNPRGKYKHKRKWKKRVDVSATVVPRQEGVAWDEQGVDAFATGNKLKRAQKKGADVCRLTRRFKFSSVGEAPEAAPKGEHVVAMFSRLYSMLNPSGGKESDHA